MFLKEEDRHSGEVAPAKVLDEPARLLLRAAELIEERGLCQGSFGSTPGPLCFQGAILYAKTGREYGPLSDKMSIAYQRMYDALGTDPTNWNDSPGRTQAEVVAKLREVALS